MVVLSITIKFDLIGFFCFFMMLFVFSFNSQKMAYSGCPGKTSKFIFDLYMFAVSTPQRCATLFMANGEVIVPVAAKTMRHGIKIHNSV